MNENQAQLDQDAVDLAKAIRQAESGGNFNARGASGEYGAYQYTKPTWEAESVKYLGRQVPLEQATPEEQNEVMYKKIKELKDKGWNVGQIASYHNSGDKDAFMRDHRGVNRFGVQYDTPAYAEKVATTYQQFKSQRPQPVATIPEQKELMRSQGEPVSVKDNRVEPTLGGEIIRGTLRPVAKMLARPLQMIGALSGLTPEQQTIKSSYLGDITAPTTGKDVLKDVGAGLQTASLGIGTGGAANAVAQFGKQSLGQQAVRLGLEGLLAGGIGGAGYAMEEGKPAEDVATQGALGAGIGLGTGILAPVAGVALRKAGGLLRKIPGPKRIAQYAGIIKPGEIDVEREIANVAQEYSRASGTSIPNKFRQKNMTRTGDFVPAEEWLARNGIVPQEGPNKTWDVDKALEDIDAVNENVFKRAKQEIIKNENAYFNVDEAIKLAEARIDRELPSEVARDKAKARIQEEVETILAKLRVQKNIRGERLANVLEMERLRDVGNSLRKFDQMDAQGINQVAGDALSKSINNIIDKYATFPGYRKFNREWSNLLNAQRWLETLRGKTVRLSKGLSGQIAMKMFGPLFGYSKGGVVGAILGDLGAETIGRVLSDPELRTIVSRSIIKNAQKKLPREEIIEQLMKEIAEFETRSASQLRLPPPSYMEGQPFKGGASEMIIDSGTPPPQSFEEAAQRKAGKDIQPKTLPSMLSETKRLELPPGTPGAIPGKTIPLGARSQSTIDKQEMDRVQGILRRKGGQELYGGIAGIEKDEDGGIGFSPEKAAAGVLGVGALRRAKNISDDLIKEAKKYKSADEFVRAQMDKASVLTEKPIKLYRGEGKGIGNTTYVRGRYYTDNKKMAETFGDVSEIKLPKGTKVFDFGKIKNDINQKLIPQEMLVDPKKLTQYLIKQGYDVTKNPTARGGVEYVFLKDKIAELARIADNFEKETDFLEEIANNYDKYRNIFSKTPLELGDTSEAWRMSKGLDSKGEKYDWFKKPQIVDIWNKANKAVSDAKPYKETGDLTTKILKDLEGKTTVSKQYILDATNRGDLKQVERDLIRKILDESTDSSSLSQSTYVYRGQNNEKFTMEGKSAGIGKSFTTDKKIAEVYGNKGKIIEGFVENKDILKYNELDIKTKKYIKSIIDERIDEVRTGLENEDIKPFEKLVLELGEIARIKNKKAIDISSFGIPSESEIRILSEDAIRTKPQSADTVNVADFASKVKAELLPLKMRTTATSKNRGPNAEIADFASGQYENISLPKETRGSVKDYAEHIFESPIKTSAGETHFGQYKSIKNYFGHTRIEDMADDYMPGKKVSRVIEVQSDLYQKGNLQRELNVTPKNYPSSPVQPAKEGTKRFNEVQKLQQYNDRTAHFRMIREELKKAAQKGDTHQLYPTGETAMKIEGLGQQDTGLWKLIEENPKGSAFQYKSLGDLTPDKLKVGSLVDRANDQWIITDVLGDGKFKAVPKDAYERATEKVRTMLEDVGEEYDKLDFDKAVKNDIEFQTEQFDISGKVDTENPIYKFYEKDVQQYLKKFGGTRVKDNKGVEWIEVPIKKEWGDMPVEAFSMIGGVGLLRQLRSKKKEK